MDIFSKRDGPRPEDLRAKKLISENAGAIRQLADTITNGGFTRMRRQEAERRAGPQAQGLIFHHARAAVSIDAPEPYVKVSHNGRVVLVDRGTGRQLQMLGEIRGGRMSRQFTLATAANGFLSPLPPEAEAALADLSGAPIGREFDETALAAALEARLGLGETAAEDPAAPEDGA